MGSTCSRARWQLLQQPSARARREPREGQRGRRACIERRRDEPRVLREARDDRALEPLPVAEELQGAGPRVHVRQHADALAGAE